VIELDLPTDVELARTTAELDETTVPDGLLRSHRIAADVWGRLVVRSGSVRFVFEHGGLGTPVTLVAGDRQVIPPDRPHHLEIVGPVRFVVEFHRRRATDTVRG
jgi:tellurite resistance-related uncharacterized protein